MPPPGLDLTKLDNLNPAKAQSLFFAGSAGNDNKTTVASVDAAFLYESVVLDHTIYITSVSCSGSKLQIQYNSEDAYLHAKTAWGPTSKIMLVTSSASCGASSESTVFLTSSFTFDDASMAVQATGAITQLKDVVSTAEMSFGSGSNVTLAVPSCADVPANTTINFPMVPCGSVFDKTLDNKIGYYSGSEADLDSLYKEIAPTTSNAIRRVFRRAFTPLPLPNWVSAVAALTSGVSTIGEMMAASAMASAAQITAIATQGLGQGSSSFDFDSKVLKTARSQHWGWQTLLFVLSKANGGTTESEGFSVYCVDCSVNGKLAMSTDLVYDSKKGITAARLNLNGRFLVNGSIGVTSYSKYTFSRDLELISTTLGRCTIPGFAAIDPHVRLNAHIQLSTRQQGEMLAGFSSEWANLQANLDFVSPNMSIRQFTGSTPRISPNVEAYADAGLNATVGFPFELSFGFNVMGITKSGGITFTPAVSAVVGSPLMNGSSTGQDLDGCVLYQISPAFAINAINVNTQASVLANTTRQDSFKGCTGSLSQSTSVSATRTTIIPIVKTTIRATTTISSSAVTNSSTGKTTSDLTQISSPSTTSASRSMTTSSLSVVSSTSSTTTTTTTIRTTTPITTTTTTTPITTTTTTTPITTTTTTTTTTAVTSSTTIITTTSTTTSSSPIVEPTCGSTYKTADGRSWLIDCQIDYSGPVIQRLTTSSMSACVKACSDFGYNCRSAVWVPSGQADTWCYLKSSYDAGSNALAGLTVLAARPVVPYQGCPAADNSVFQDKAGAAYRVECGIDYPGDDIGFNSTVTTFEDCLDACDNKSGCVGASWVHGGSRANNPYCTFKSIMRNSSRTSDSSYSFKVDSVTLLMNTTTSITKQKRDIPSTPPHHNSISTSLQTRDDKNIAMTDITGTFQLLPDADGNLYLSKNYSVSNPLANFALTTGVVYSDAQSRLLLFFPDTMAAYSASRIRLATTSAVPKGSRLLTWVPLGLNNSTVFTAMDTTGQYYFPVACVYSDSDKIKVLLVKNSLGDLSFLQDEKLQHVLTGGVVQNCEPIALSAKGVPNLVTLNATAS